MLILLLISEHQFEEHYNKQQPVTNKNNNYVIFTSLHRYLLTSCLQLYIMYMHTYYSIPFNMFLLS